VHALPPLSCVQAPAPLHVVAPGHSPSGFFPSSIAPHTPSAPWNFFAAVHAWHSPVHVVSQHTESTQRPFAHSLPAPQLCPARPSHAPAPLHAFVAPHSASGSVVAATIPHVPSDPLPFFAAVHASQLPAHAMSQHT
jgi:hypothetical protein